MASDNTTKKSTEFKEQYSKWRKEIIEWLRKESLKLDETAITFSNLYTKHVANAYREVARRLENMEDQR